MIKNSLFFFVLGIFLLAVWQTSLAREGSDLQEEIGVTVDPQRHHDGSGSIKQVSQQDTPESIIGDTIRRCGTRMEGPSNMGPLTLVGRMEQDVRLHLPWMNITCCISALMFLQSSVLFYIHIDNRSQQIALKELFVCFICCHRHHYPDPGHRVK